MLAIALEELTKTYPGGKQAVRQVSLSLEEGEVFGFLGPNGAGKTTTVKLLTGMLRPSAGSCRVFGLDPAAEPEKVHALSGVVTEHAQMYDNLSGMQNLFGGQMPGGKMGQMAMNRMARKMKKDKAKRIKKLRKLRKKH